MATKCSIAPAVVWNWVIEALASSEQADISTLIGLVKMAPAISGDAGKDTREIVSLRILESLFDNGNEATVDGKAPKISFDPSERCEDVLKKILHETREPNNLEKEKWEVGPFVKHKRSSLPECMLKKLKEAILNDNNPLLASLKEKSNLEIPNASEDTSPTNDEPLNCRNDKNELQENMLQDGNMPPQDINTKGHNERLSVDSMENLEFVVRSKDSDKIVQRINERANDDDDERTDVAAKKDAFLKSQCTVSQDSLTLTEWSEIDRCMKCNESGELLLCSSASCPLRFHESCLGPAVTLEENGEFFCPFCAYSRAISKYQEAKRNASLARKNLQAFSSFTVKPKPNKSSTKQSGLAENENRQMDDNNVNCMSNEKDSAQRDPIIPDVNDEDGASLEQTTELPQNPIPEPTTPKQKRKEKESQRSTESSLATRLRKRKAEHAPPLPVLLVRRKKLPWTKSEEETLKEGVERYSSGNNAKIPWKEILDFGHNVFHKGRTAIDLKDKWRNMCK
ncbi:putative transcription factor MYB-HB-like family [Helianthus anomalus]